MNINEAKDESKKKASEPVENLETYRTLVNNLPVGVYRNTPGPKGHFLQVNPAMVSMFEADSAEDFLKHGVSDLYQNAVERELFVKNIMKHGFVTNEELDLVTLKGKALKASVTAVMKKDTDGSVYFDGVLEDITERKKREDARLYEAHIAMDNVFEDLTIEKRKAETLANDLKKFKLALDNASDQVTITDIEGTVVYANAAVEKITGYKPEDAIGKKAGVLWSTPMPREYYQHLWHVIKDEKKTYESEIQNRKKNGQIYTAAINITPLLDAGGDVVFFVGLERDVTKERQVDKAKSEFISLASHQMRTPLTAINWYTEMLLDGDAGELNPKQKEYFNEIYTADRRMNDIIKSFLHILSLEAGALTMKPVLVNVPDIVKETIRNLQLETKKKHLSVVERFQESLPPISIDLEIIRVVLQNLISNAVKYTPENGEIIISLDTVKQGSVVGGKTTNQDSLLVNVRDTGMGISRNDQDKIFGKFFRTESARKWDPNGNGLGLYMTKIMMSIVNGTIWFDSEEGKGTAFYVLFPLEQKK